MSYKKTGRVWLNPKKSDDTGALSWETTADKWGVTGDLTIRDCSRQITLTFDETNRQDRLAKFDLLLKEITAMRAAYVVGCEKFDKAKK